MSVASGGNANNTKPVSQYLTVNSSGQIESTLPVKVDGDITSTGDVYASNGHFTQNVYVAGDIIATDKYICNQLIVGTDPTTGLSVYFNKTDGTKLQSGTTAQRPSPAYAGVIRYNTDLSALEYYDGSVWNTVTSGDLSAIQYQSASSNATTWTGAMHMVQRAGNADQFTLYDSTATNSIALIPDQTGSGEAPEILLQDSLGNTSSMTSTQIGANTLVGNTINGTNEVLSGTNASLVVKDNSNTNIVYVNPNVPTPIICNGNINAYSFITSNSTASTVFQTKDAGGATTSIINNAGDFQCNSLTVLSSDAQILANGDASFVKVTANSGSLLGNLDMNTTNKIINLANGTASSDAATYGQLTGSIGAYTAFTGPTTSTKTFTLPNANATILTDASAVTVAQGGTGVSTLTTPYGLLCAGTTATGNVQTLSSLGTSGQVLTSNGAGALPSWGTVSGGVQGGFSVVNGGGSVGNVTGDGTAYQPAFNTASFDILGEYNTSTYTFTASATGYWIFTCDIGFTNMTSSSFTDASIYLTTTSAGNPYMFRGNGFNCANGSQLWITGSYICKMNSGDTCKLYVNVGGGTKTVGINANTKFGGMRIQ